MDEAAPRTEERYPAMLLNIASQVGCNGVTLTLVDEVGGGSDLGERIVVAGKDTDTVPVGMLGAFDGRAAWRIFDG